MITLHQYHLFIYSSIYVFIYFFIYFFCNFLSFIKWNFTSARSDDHLAILQFIGERRTEVTSSDQHLLLTNFDVSLLSLLHLRNNKKKQENQSIYCKIPRVNKWKQVWENSRYFLLADVRDSLRSWFYLSFDHFRLNFHCW